MPMPIPQTDRCRPCQSRNVLVAWTLGKVDFRSELEEGTMFYLELPEAPAV